jgi:hypothetical protein
MAGGTFVVDDGHAGSPSSLAVMVSVPARGSNSGACQSGVVQRVSHPSQSVFHRADCG